MSSVVISGDTSGAITIAAPAVAGTNTLTLPAQTATVITDSSAALNIGSGQIYKDASGNVGIGTTSPSSYANAGLVVVGTGATGLGDGQVTAYSSSAQAAGYGGQIVFGGQDGVAAIRTFASVLGAKENSTSGNYASYLGFNTRANGGSVSERMRIDSNGYLLIGYTSSNGAYKLQVNSQIFATSSTIATSDARYKTDVTPISGALDIVNALNPVEFNWKEHPVHDFDTTNKTVGFLAQEVQEVLKDKPYVNSIIKKNDCIIEPEEKDEDGNVTKEAVTEEFLGIAEGNIIPILTKAIQEQQTIIETLKTDIAELKAKVNV